VSTRPRSKTVLSPELEKAVALALDRARAVDRAEELSRGLDAIGVILLRLGASLDRELVGLADATRGTGWGRCLSVDEDRRFALYLVSEEPRATSPAHEHLTWQVTACLHGRERQRLYARSAGRRTVRAVHEVVLSPGTHLAMLPDQIHSTVVVSDEPTVHLQMFGVDVAQLPDLASRTFSAEA
jgi:predicted metal-dependent enzyme (double-stranded beta helix superfamily)